MAAVFDTYALATAWDEMFEQPGVPRPAYEPLFSALGSLDAPDLIYRSEQLARSFTDRGVTFAFAGEERPFPLDLVPRLIAAKEWDQVSRGVAQRVRALDAYLSDVYGEGRIFAEGVISRRLVYSCPGFRREVAGFQPPGGVRCHVAGIDLVRDEQGRFVVLEDNVRVPSGVSYVIENRRAMTHVFPSVFAEHRIHPVDIYPSRLLSALRASAPDGVNDPTVVVLTPGVYNAAYFEHALLARLMGVELVEGRDLIARNNRIFMRTTSGEEPVHVIYRRVDDEFLDPLQLRPDSTLGCPGLLNAARAGNVTLANAVGNGVADDKLVYTYVPDFIRYYLGEEPILDNVETFRCEDPDVLDWVLGSVDQLVAKPVDGYGGNGIVIGPLADEQSIENVRREIAAHPRSWIAQRPVMLSTSPTLIGGQLVARHIDLRPFAVSGPDGVWVLPGGLTRVALPKGALVVNSSQGGGSKDTWVLAEDMPAVPQQAQDRWDDHPLLSLGEVPRDTAETQRDVDPTRSSAQQQQQQQQQATAVSAPTGLARTAGKGLTC